MASPSQAYTLNSANSCAAQKEAFETELSRALDSAGFKPQQGGTLICNALDAHMGMGGVDDNAAAAAHLVCQSFAIQERAVSENPEVGPQGKGYQAELAYTMESQHHQQSVANRSGVRRLMPVECERLQGFPDGWTDNCSDSQRYKMLGNAVSVPVAEWIGKRIKR